MFHLVVFNDTFPFLFFLILALRQVLLSEQSDFSGTDSGPRKQESGIRLVPINSTSRCWPRLGLLKKNNQAFCGRGRIAKSPPGCSSCPGVGSFTSHLS